MSAVRLVYPLSLLAVLSGVASVAIETVWMRWLRELLGATAPATSATLAAFFVGQAAGAGWYARRVASFARPLATYGRIELLAAAGALAAPLLLAAGGRVLADAYDALRVWPALLHSARFAVALASTLPAAFAFGAALPAIVQAAVGGARRFGAFATALYAANTLGAAVGAALGAFLLPGHIGVRATYGAALGLLAAVGALALLLAGRELGKTGTARPPEPGGALPAGAAAGAGGLGSGALAALAALSGACTFALQVLGVQALAQVLNGSIYAFGAVTVTVLVALAAGSAVVSLLARRRAAASRSILAWALTGAALLAALVPAFLARSTGGFAYVGGGAGGLAYFLAALRASALTLGPAMAVAALVFPALLVLAAQPDAGAPSRPGAIVGRLLAANVAGSIAGAICAPYLLMPALGLWGAFLGVAAVYATAAAVLPGPRSPAHWGRLAGLALGGVLVVALAGPQKISSVGLRPGDRVLESRTTPAGVVEVVEGASGRVMRIDAHYVLGGSAERIHEERQAHLPMLFAPAARRIAYVGSATGISAGAVLAHPIESLTVVELVPGVALAARRHFGSLNRGVYTDPRVEVVLDDARNFFEATRDRFDLVIADLFVPWRAGAGALFTREHFEAVRGRLSEDGVFCQWLPLYQLSRVEAEVIVATFLDVFPRAVLLRGDFYGGFPIAALLGYTGRAAPAAAVSDATLRLRAAGVEDRWVVDPVGIWALYVGPLGTVADALAAAPRNRSDRPWIEWAAAAGHAGGRRGKVDPLVALEWTRFTRPIALEAGGREDPIHTGLSANLREAIQGGVRLQQAGALWVAGHGEAAARAFGRAAALLPPRLVRAAPADPTAAELWSDE